MRWISLSLRIALTCGVLCYIFSIISFSGVITSLAATRLDYFFAAFLLMLAARIVLAYQFKFLADKQQMGLSTPQIFMINLIAGFYQLFLPGYLAGGAIRWYKLAHPSSKPVGALTSIVYSRLIDTVVLVILGILFWIVERRTQHSQLMGSAAFLLGVLLVFYCSIFTDRGFSLLQRALKRLDLPSFPTAIHSKIKELMNSIAQYRDLSHHALIYILGLSMAAHVIGMFAWYLLACSLGQNISFTSICWVRSVVIIITMLPISFSGLGVREGALAVLLGPYGILPADAVALSLLIFFCAHLFGGIGGLLEAKTFLPKK